MTINNIETLVKLISTAKAIYGNLPSDILTNVLKNSADFTGVEAAKFVGSFNYLTNSFTNNISGFQAGIFLDKSSDLSPISVPLQG